MDEEKKTPLRDKLHQIFGNILAILAIILVVIVFGGTYYFVIAPNLVSKPFMEKPFLPEDFAERINEGENVVNSSHINYLVNEVGGYKLRKKVGTKDYPIIEFIVTDANERYYTYVKDNEPVTKKGNAKGEDVIVKGSQETIAKILESTNIAGAVKEANDNKEIEVELVSDMKALAAKGYLSIYDALR